MTEIEKLIDAAESMTPDEIHQHPMAAVDKLRALARELRAARAGVVAEEPEWAHAVAEPTDWGIICADCAYCSEDPLTEAEAREGAREHDAEHHGVPVKQEGTGQ